MCMADEEQQQGTAEEKPGFGIDRTVIRDLLRMTPEERMLMVDNDARVLAQIAVVREQLRRR
jgi:hypothetical protein